MWCLGHPEHAACATRLLLASQCETRGLRKTQGARAVFGDLQGSKETVRFTQRGGQTLLILLESGQLSEGQMRPSQFTLGLKSGEQLEGSLQMFPGFCEIALRAS